MPTLVRPGWDENLHTIVKQTVPPDEIIVIIDREVSDKLQAAITEKWNEVTFLFNNKNCGVAASLNRGLRRANGEFIFRADDDDIYRKDRIERQLRCFDETGADLIGSWARGTSEDGKRDYLIKSPASHDAISRALYSRNIMIHPSLAFRRDAILNIGGYDEQFRYAQDYALYLKCLRAGLTFANVTEPLIIRTIAGDSITVRHRHQQVQFSCAARILDCAYRNDRKAFMKTIAQYAVLAATPNWARRMRRKLFSTIGTGA